MTAGAPVPGPAGNGGVRAHQRRGLGRPAHRGADLPGGRGAARPAPAAARRPLRRRAGRRAHGGDAERAERRRDPGGGLGGARRDRRSCGCRPAAPPQPVSAPTLTGLGRRRCCSSRPTGSGPPWSWTARRAGALRGDGGAGRGRRRGAARPAEIAPTLSQVVDVAWRDSEELLVLAGDAGEDRTVPTSSASTAGDWATCRRRPARASRPRSRPRRPGSRWWSRQGADLAAHRRHLGDARPGPSRCRGASRSIPCDARPRPPVPTLGPSPGRGHAGRWTARCWVRSPTSCCPAPARAATLPGRRAVPAGAAPCWRARPATPRRFPDGFPPRPRPARTRGRCARR